MNGCEEIRDRLLSLHEEALGAEERRRVEAHLATCGECARQARLLHEVLGRVQALPVPEPPGDFWEEFGAAVRRRIAAEPPPRLSLSARVAAWIGGLQGLQPMPALAAATALGLLLAIGLVRTQRSPRDLPPVEALAFGEELGIAQNLELLENLEVLEEVDVLERLDMLRRLNGGTRSRMS
jgi:anti-sigma factor RsiW